MAAADHRLKAAILISAAVFVAAAQDVIVKWISGLYPVHEILTVRCLAAVPLLAIIAARSGGLAALATPHWPKAVARGLVLCSAYLAFILSIASAPIADSVAVYFTMPLIVAALSWPILGERVSAGRWAAIAVGFAGVLIMNGVTRGLLDPAALLALYSAFGYGVGQMMGRRFAPVLSPPVLAFHQNLVYLATALVLAAVFSGWGHETGKTLAFLTRPWAAPPFIDFAWMAAMGALGAAGMVLFSSAYKNAEASFVAPFEYTAMFWAVLFGFAVFGDWPSPWTFLGAAIVITAGLYMIREPASAAPATRQSSKASV